MAFCNYVRAADSAVFKNHVSREETHQPSKAFISLYFIVGVAGLGSLLMMTCFFFNVVPKQARLRWWNNVRKLFGLSGVSVDVPEPEIDEIQPIPVDPEKVVSPDTLSVLFPQHELTAPDNYDAEPTMCCICLDVIPVGSSIRALDCGHTFHSSCIASWLTMYRRQCPLCNHVIPKDCTQLGVSQSQDEIAAEVENTAHAQAEQAIETTQSPETGQDQLRTEAFCPPEPARLHSD